MQTNTQQINPQTQTHDPKNADTNIHRFTAQITQLFEHLQLVILFHKHTLTHTHPSVRDVDSRTALTHHFATVVVNVFVHVHVVVGVHITWFFWPMFVFEKSCSWLTQVCLYIRIHVRLLSYFLRLSLPEDVL